MLAKFLAKYFRVFGDFEGRKSAYAELMRRETKIMRK